MANHTIEISAAGAVVTTDTSVKGTDTVSWHNNGTKEVAITFQTNSWPFSNAAGPIALPGNANSTAYSINVNIGKFDFNVSRDGRTTGSGELDVGTIDDANIGGYPA